jgi:hypothetical protein
VLTAAGSSLPLRRFAATLPDGWQPPFDWVQAADAAGIARLIVSDRVLFGANLEAYASRERVGIEGGKQPKDPDGSWLGLGAPTVIERFEALEEDMRKQDRAGLTRSALRATAEGYDRIDIDARSAVDRTPPQARSTSDEPPPKLPGLDPES